MKRVAADGATHWESTALPLLERLVAKEQALRDRGLLELGAGQNGAEWLELAMTDGELYETLHQLRDLDCIGFKVERAGGPSAMFLDLRLTGRGLQVLGEWPRFEAWTSPATLVAFADQLAEFASPEHRTRLERAAAYLRSQAPGAIKGAAIAATSQLVRNVLGLA
jgi:hypothetical protein